MYFRKRSVPELAGKEPEEQKQLIRDNDKRLPIWVEGLALAVIAINIFSVLPFVRDLLLVHMTYRWATICAGLLTYGPLFFIYRFAIVNFWLRPELRRIEANEPNQRLQQAGDT